jgi:phage terminase large subunit
LRPTIRKKGSRFFIVFNPDEENDPAYKMFVKNPIKGTNSVFVNYNDNKFFTDELKAEMEYDRKVDYDSSLTIWDGQCRKISDAVIFKGKYEVLDFEVDSDSYFYFGSDFGFSNDPLTLNRMSIKNNCLYIDYEVYKVGVEIDHTPALYDTIPEVRNYIIVGDSARPELISYLRRQGFNIRSSKKGAGSIVEGIEFIRSFEKIYIHPRCVNTLKEFSSYSYITDRITGEITRKIEDKNNHIIDNIRYALERYRKGLKRNSVSASDLGL